MTDSLTAAGIYRTDQAQYDDDGLIMPLSLARKLLQYETEASAIEVKLLPGTDAESAMEAIRQKLGDKFIVKDRLRQQEMNFRMIEIEKWVTFLLLFFILIIASFNIISTMSMAVLEKQKSMSAWSPLRNGYRSCF